jgi:hypothetical protein
VKFGTLNVSDQALGEDLGYVSRVSHRLMMGSYKALSRKPMSAFQMKFLGYWDLAFPDFQGLQLWSTSVRHDLMPLLSCLLKSRGSYSILHSFCTAGAAAVPVVWSESYTE